MVRWLRWHCPPDTGFEIQTLAVWGRVRYLSVTEAPHNTNFHTWMGKKHFCYFQTAKTGNRTPNSGVKGSGANHYPRAPALLYIQTEWGDDQVKIIWHCPQDTDATSWSHRLSTMTRQDKTRQDKTRQDKTRQDKTRQDKTRQDKTRQCMTNLDVLYILTTSRLTLLKSVVLFS